MKKRDLLQNPYSACSREKKDKGKIMILANDKMIIGYDLSYEYAQISYQRQGGEMPETFALVSGTKQYNIPVSLFKRNGVNQWFLGKEAIAFSKQEEGTLLTGLLQAALEEREIQIGEEVFESIALLALFIKRSLYLPGKECKPDKLAGIMITLPDLSEKMIALLQRLVLLLNLPDCKIYFQGREESIYYYMIHQPRELWNGDVLFFDSSEETLKSYRFMKNSNTRPMVAFVEESFHGALSGEDEEKDGQFLEIVRQRAADISSSVFLLGEGFNGEWCQESLRFLCHNRRVFKGNDLYSRGACYSLQEKMSDRSSQNPSIIFLGKDKLKTNVGMEVSRQGEDSYLAILDGGENWYECQKQWDLILREGNVLKFKLTPLDGRNVRYVEVVLDGLPLREKNTTRLHLEAVMTNERTVKITIKDMGFGEMFPSSDLCFVQQFDLGPGGR